MGKNVMLVMLLMMSLLLVGYGSCLAVDVALQWDPNTEPDLAGYKVYYKADSTSLPFNGTGAAQGAAPVLSTQPTASLTGLDPAHSYSFAVTAYNSSGVESSYSNIITIPESLAPSTSITYPAANASVSGTVSVTASAADNVGVSKVEFYLDNILKSTDTSTPYLYSWNTTTSTPGAHTLVAKAYDAAGNIGQSVSLPVNVVNDTIAPTVAITSPTTGSEVSGTVSVAAAASDNIGISRIEFYRNDVMQAAVNTTPYSYSWDTNTVADGSHNLSARAYDAAGNSAQSASVSVNVSNVVADTIVPVVSLTNPGSGATVKDTITVSASANDNVGITKVEFYLNGVLQSTRTGMPYSYNWDTKTTADGSYTLSAIAFDAAGNSAQAASVSVTVRNIFVDTTAPNVTLTNPVSGATLRGTVSITASASDNVGVAKVEFYVNGVLKASKTAAPYSYSWGTKSVANGSYTVSAIAYDAAGNAATSNSAMVQVKNRLR
jgi:hypothetical protein